MDIFIVTNTKDNLFTRNVKNTSIFKIMQVENTCDSEFFNGSHYLSPNDNDSLNLNLNVRNRKLK